VPYPLFEELVDWVKESDLRKNKVTNKPIKEVDAFGNKAAPADLLVLGVLRVLGRGMCFDGISELSLISMEVNRVFFHDFCRIYAKELFESACGSPTSKADIAEVMRCYDRLGLPGCIGSTDCVHINWDRCPANERNLHKGKETYPTLSYSVTCTPSRRIIAVTQGYSGTTNDKTISR